MLTVVEAPSIDASAEAHRLSTLDDYDILDTPREDSFDRITRLMRRLFDVPIALVTFIDAHRQWYKSCEGLLSSEVSRDTSFCRHVLEEDRAIVVADASTDTRFKDSSFVTGAPHIRFYVGCPLRAPDDTVVGTLCLVDLKPREFTRAQLELLGDLSQMVIEILELRRNANRDSLTGTLSRRAFKEAAARSCALALREHRDLSMIAIDLDHFKAINDVYGHPTGDLVLKGVANAWTAILRQSDALGRIGGEEFAAILPNTSLHSAEGLAERLRAETEALSLTSDEGDPLQVTASFGISALDLANRDVDALLAAADKALYAAKTAGRNRISTWRSKLETPSHRRVLKAGQIVFNGRNSTVDCTVRALSDEGAAIDVFNALVLPTQFNLAIKCDNLEKPCRVISKTDKRVEVAFV